MTFRWVVEAMMFVVSQLTKRKTASPAADDDPNMIRYCWIQLTVLTWVFLRHWSQGWVHSPKDLPFRRIPTLKSTEDTPIFDADYYNRLDEEYQTSRSITLTRFLDSLVKEDPELIKMQSLLLGLQMACKTIANVVNRAGLARNPNDTNGRFFSMKRLDQLSTMILKNALQYTGQCEIIQLDNDQTTEHRPGVLIAKSLDETLNSTLACILDPLDGSGNADASIGTGTIFGIYDTENPDMVEAVLQPARKMKAAGYCMYSSATVLVFTVDETVQCFTLDPQRNEFILTHSNMEIPNRGNIYSCNEANAEGWDEGFRSYLRKLKTGTGQSEQTYALRYVGSMVGDLHRTLLYGGVFAYPSDSLSHPEGNLQLLYKTAPLAVILERAGGKTTNGTTSLLDVQPGSIHQKTPCFLGSPDDIDELQHHLESS